MRACSQGSAGAERLSSLQVFANNSSLHGISHIFRHGSLSLRRVLWALFFLGSLGLLLLVCMERVNYFFTYPHVTKLDEVAAPNLTFPAITICNLNEFRFSRITRNDLYHVGQLLALLSDRYEIRSPHLAEPQLLAALRDKANFRNFKAKPFDMADFYNRTGHDMAEMLLQCSFRGTDCTAQNFTASKWRPKRYAKPELMNILHNSVEDSYKRLIYPLLCREFRSKLTSDAEKESIMMFGRNLRQLLLTSPVRGRTLMGVDPGYKHGCKLAIISPTSQILHTDVVYLHSGQGFREAEKIRRLLVHYNCSTVVIGNGTACRETEAYFADLIMKKYFAPLDVVYWCKCFNAAPIYSVPEAGPD
nr:acid-sensing ion channel 1C-like [Chelonoidis abingdonii]